MAEIGKAADGWTVITKKHFLCDKCYREWEVRS